MTYLFLSIAIGLVSAVTKIKDAPDSLEYVFLGGVVVVMLVITYCLESNLLIKKEAVKVIVYENIELIQTSKQTELMADIKSRTGFDVHRISIQKIDFLKDSAQIKIYYYE